MSGVMIKSFQMAHEGEQGVSCIFDCRFSPDGTLCAAADGSGYLSLLGRGSSLPYQQVNDTLISFLKSLLIHSSTFFQVFNMVQTLFVSQSFVVYTNK